MRQSPSRRSLLALTASATLGTVAGCLGADDDTQNGDGDTDEESTVADVTPATPQVPFRDWLTDPDAIDGDRFEYSEGQLEQVTQGRASVLDIDLGDVDAFLIQLPVLVIFGDFDVPALEATLEATDEYRLTDEYSSYRMAEPVDADDTDEEGLIASQFALGSDAVLVGRDLDRWIDTAAGDAERLETAYPVFEDVFATLPDRASVTGELGSPLGWDIDGVTAWGHSLPTLDPGEITGTWTYAFDESPTTEQITAVEQQLAEIPLSGEVDETTTDGRFLTVTAALTLPDPDEEPGS